jgi:hypothetical protein
MATTIRAKSRKKSTKKPTRNGTAIDTVVGSWSDTQKKRALTKLVREFIRDGSQPIYVEGVGIITPILGLPRLIEFDDSTPHLRELRRRAENPEGSVSLDDIIAERKRRATNPE